MCELDFFFVIPKLLIIVHACIIDACKVLGVLYINIENLPGKESIKWNKAE